MKHSAAPVKLFPMNGLLKNEVKWYQKFCNCAEFPQHTPKLLDYSYDSLVLEFAGSPITKETIPVDFKNQIREIAYFLQNNHCYHCDITPGNLLVLDNRLFLIDFGWSVKVGQDPYRRWRKANKEYLKCMGSQYRAPDWPNDRYSLARIYKEFAGNPDDKLYF